MHHLPSSVLCTLSVAKTRVHISTCPCWVRRWALPRFKHRSTLGRVKTRRPWVQLTPAMHRTRYFVVKTVISVWLPVIILCGRLFVVLLIAPTWLAIPDFQARLIVPPIKTLCATYSKTYSPSIPPRFGWNDSVLPACPVHH